jgi:hypothetical protein
MTDTLSLVITNPIGGRLQATDIGTVLTFTSTDGSAVVDLSMMNTKTLLIKKPSGAGTSVSLEFGTDGSNGVTKYTTLVTDFADPGQYQLQGYFVDSDGNQFHTNIILVTVYPILAGVPG